LSPAASAFAAAEPASAAQWHGGRLAWRSLGRRRMAGGPGYSGWHGGGFWRPGYWRGGLWHNGWWARR